MSGGGDIKLSVDVNAGDNENERERYGINSPRKANTTEKADEVPNPLASMLTQVDRPGAKQDDGGAPEAEQLEPMNVEEKVPASGGGGCLSWLCCCLSPTSAAPQPKAEQLEPKQADPAPVQTKPAAVYPEPEDEPKAQKTTNEPEAGAQVTQKPEAETEKDEEMPEANPGKTWEEQYINTRSDSEEDPEGYMPKNTTGRRKCLVLDLDETLVHSSFKRNPGDPTPDFIVPVTIDNIVHKVYVLKRPYCNEFLREMAKYWEVVIFTASLSKYANPLLDMLDKEGTISHRLFREHCVLHGGNYVKDLTKLGRKLKNQVIIDNAPKSYLFQPHNAVPITSWFDDMNDTELLDCIPVLSTTLIECDDVRDVLEGNNVTFQKLCSMAKQ